MTAGRLLLGVLAGVGAYLALTATAKAKAPPEREKPPEAPPAKPNGFRQMPARIAMQHDQRYQYASMRYGPKALSQFRYVKVLRVNKWFERGGIVTTFEWVGPTEIWEPPAWLRGYGYLRYAPKTED